MRAKRSKQYRKLMKQYALSFNFREPYQVLLDSQIIIDAAGFKMQLGKMLQDTLSGEIKPMITQCSIRHLYNLPATTEAEKKSKDSYIEVAKAAERRRCGHHELEEPLSTLDCLQSVVDPKNSGTNKHRYVVASQELEVRAKMREIAGVPLIYVKRSVMNLEPMAGKTAEVIQREEKGKIRAGLRTMRGAGVGEKRKRDEEDETAAQDTDQLQDGTAEEPGTKKKKVKGPKGPNPLSVKKSKKDKQAAVRHPQAAETSPDHTQISAPTPTQDANGVIDGPRKRKRKRKPKGEVTQTADTVV